MPPFIIITVNGSDQGEHEAVMGLTIPLLRQWLHGASPSRGRAGHWPVSMVLVCGLVLVQPALVGSAPLSPVLSEYRALFAALEQNGRITEPARWPDHGVLTPYLHYERFIRQPETATLEALQGFVGRWPDHPLMSRVERLLERAITRYGGNREALVWFDRRPPRGNAMRLRYMQILLSVGRREEARKQWLHLYRAGTSFPSSVQQDHDRFSQSLSRDDKEARARALARQGKKRRRALELILKHFSPARQRYFWALYHAHQANKRFHALVERLPAPQAQAAELWSARIDGLYRFGFRDKALSLLEGREGRWLDGDTRRTMRYRLGRAALFIDDDPAVAYRLLSANVREKGGTLEDSTWLAGWSAYRMGRREDAQGVFMRLAREAGSGPRRSQGAWWAAHLSPEQSREARQWLEWAARHPESFYGLLALEELKGTLPPLAEKELACRLPSTDARFKAGIARLADLKAVGREFYNGAELDALADRLKMTDEQRLCLAREYDAPDLAVRVAKGLAGKGDDYWTGLYPTPAWKPRTGWSLRPFVLWGLARQESLFQFRVASSAGAQGVTQLMPATARHEAGLLNLPEADSYRLSIPTYNLALGQSYLSRMLEKFDGDLVQGLISYNAGPGRAWRWRERRAKEDPLTYIENTPITETRHYVKRVLHGVVLYQARQEGRASLKALLPPGKPGMDRLRQ